jgi:hypothetical protein
MDGFLNKRAGEKNSQRAVPPFSKGGFLIPKGFFIAPRTIRPKGVFIFPKAVFRL